MLVLSTETKFGKFILYKQNAVQWNLDLRKIVATTDFLVHKLFDLRKIF